MRGSFRRSSRASLVVVAVSALTMPGLLGWTIRDSVDNGWTLHHMVMLAVALGGIYGTMLLVRSVVVGAWAYGFAEACKDGPLTQDEIDSIARWSIRKGRK